MLVKRSFTGLLVAITVVSCAWATPTPSPTPERDPFQAAGSAPLLETRSETKSSKAPVFLTPRVSERDPFANLGAHKQEVPRPEARPQEHLSTTPSNKTEHTVGRGILPPPLALLKGTVMSPSGNQAIVQTANNCYLLKAGDQVGDYRVAQVESHQVKFTYKDKVFVMPLQQEFAKKHSH